jgi:hypothetical protein
MNRTIITNTQLSASISPVFPTYFLLPGDLLSD